MRKDVIAQKGTAIAIMQENLKDMEGTLEELDTTIKELKESDEEIKKALEEKIDKKMDKELNKKGEQLENIEKMFKIAIGIMIVITIFLIFKLSLIRSEMDYINRANTTVIGVQAKEDLKEKYIEFAEERGIKYNNLKSTSNNIEVFETFELHSLTDNQIKNGLKQLKTNEFNIEIEEINFEQSGKTGYKIHLQE
ncbi:MAG: hypothetical protein RSG48_06375 [Clostridia bacterium]